MKISLRYLFLLFACVALMSSAFVGCSKKEAALTRAVLNKPAPQFSLVDLQGKKFDLAAMKGKVVFVNLWATWCPTCRAEMPSVLRLSRKMAGKPFVLVTILVNDNPANAKAFYKALGGSLRTLMDPTEKVAKAFGITGVPETYIVDKQGILRQKVIGGWTWDSPQAVQLIDKVLSR